MIGDVEVISTTINVKMIYDFASCLEHEIELLLLELWCYQETRDDHTVIDIEDCGDDDGAVVPMFVRHTEAFLDEIDRMVLEFNKS